MKNPRYRYLKKHLLGSGSNNQLKQFLSTFFNLKIVNLIVLFVDCENVIVMIKQLLI